MAENLSTRAGRSLPLSAAPVGIFLPHEVLSFSCLAWRSVPVIFLWLIPALAQAQVQFTTNDLPSQVGDYSLSYFSSNVNVSAYLALNTNTAPPPPGGGTAIVYQDWNFSSPQQSNESTIRTDIVSPSLGENGGYFPFSSYAEKVSNAGGSTIGWTYYGFSAEGREYYGFDADLPLTSPLGYFSAPSVDIPATVEMGQTWTRSATWNSIYLSAIWVNNSFSATATVDAAGTLSLPGIGSVPALRVHEVHSYVGSVSSVVVDSRTNDSYYWLAPKVGVVMQVTLYGTNAANGIAAPCSNSVQRMCYASYFTNPPPPTPTNPPPSSPTGLQVFSQGSSIVIKWNSFTNSSHYEIDFTRSLTPQDWQALTNTTGNAWTDSMGYTEGFYRVIGKP